MRLADILAFFVLPGLTYADVVCKIGSPLAGDGPPGSVLVEEFHNHTALMSIELLCDAIDTKDFVTHQVRSALFTITRLEEQFGVGDCKKVFDNIIEDCVHGQNVKGGSLTANGLAHEVLYDVTPIPNNTSGLPGRMTLRNAAKQKPASKKPDAIPKKTLAKIQLLEHRPRNHVQQKHPEETYP